MFNFNPGLPHIENCGKGGEGGGRGCLAVIAQWQSTSYTSQRGLIFSDFLVAYVIQMAGVETIWELRTLSVINSCPNPTP